MDSRFNSNQPPLIDSARADDPHDPYQAAIAAEHARRNQAQVDMLREDIAALNEQKEAARATGVIDDPVRPKHYQGDLVMRIIEHFGLQDNFYLGNVIKYILRHKSKAGLTDLEKAMWYLQRAIDVQKGVIKPGSDLK